MWSKLSASWLLALLLVSLLVSPSVHGQDSPLSATYSQRIDALLQTSLKAEKLAQTLLQKLADSGLQTQNLRADLLRTQDELTAFKAELKSQSEASIESGLALDRLRGTLQTLQDSLDRSQRDFETYKRHAEFERFWTGACSALIAGLAGLVAGWAFF